MRKIKIAATQMACDWNIEGNIARAESLVRDAAAEGANVILIQELFATPYFCKDQLSKHFALAQSAESSPIVSRLQSLARELGVVLPASFFERSNNAYYNSVAMIDADGKVLGIYRKSHIPDGPGYQEKFYFSPGDTGFKVWETAAGKLGVGICWDQWFPEAARSMVLKGAEVLFYPTAIGSEPADAGMDSASHWQRVMQGHAGANLVPLVASNRIGEEQGETSTITFYGSSFIAGPTGEKLAEADRVEQAVLVHEFDLDEILEMRAEWGLFRDRRPDLYGSLLSMDGHGK